MFTLEDIKMAHSKVQSGADFPRYIQDLKALGVRQYTLFVEDGHVEYLSDEGVILHKEATYPPFTPSKTSDAPSFLKHLKDHQAGKTDYMTFCRDAVATGIAKWIVDTEKMTCTYYDTHGLELLVETIPTP